MRRISGATASAREPHALFHAARELLGVRLLEAIEPHQVDGAGDRVAPRGPEHPARLEAHRHVFGDGEPGEQGKRLKHHGGGAEHSVEPASAIQHGPVGGAC